jgi:hypothetical protein
MSSSEALQLARKKFIASGDMKMAALMAQTWKQRTAALGTSTLQEAIKTLCQDFPEETYEAASKGLPPL